MSSAPPDLDGAEELVPDQTDPRTVFRRSLVKGVAVLLPLVVTLFVISVVLGFIYGQLSPLIDAVVGTGVVDSEVLVAVVTVLVFFALVLAIGFLAEYAPGNTHFGDDLDTFMASLPGIGSVYTSFNEMTELLLDPDTDSFQEFKLVEYPGEDSYVVAFKTAETPAVIADGTGNEDMITLFMPMAPNPVMGGFVIHVSRDRVVDVDLTVEEGIRSIVTSGVAVTGDDGSVPPAAEEQLRTLGDLDDRGTVAGVDATPDAVPDEAVDDGGSDGVHRGGRGGDVDGGREGPEGDRDARREDPEGDGDAEGGP